MTGFVQHLIQRIAWAQVPAWLSAGIAFASVCWAILESRAKSREAAERAADAKKYTQALETVIQYGGFVQHLEGVDKRVGNVADELGRIAKRTADIAELASSQVDKAMTSLIKMSTAANEVAQQLAQIGRTALRAQRDSFRAHKHLVGEIGDPDSWHLPNYEDDIGTYVPDGSLRQKVMEWMRAVSDKGEPIRFGSFYGTYAHDYNIMAVAEELSRMEKDRLISITRPLGLDSIIAFVVNPGATGPDTSKHSGRLPSIEDKRPT